MSFNFCGILKIQNALIVFYKSRKQQVFTVHEGQNITTSYECDATCCLKSQQLEPLPKILAKSKAFDVIFTFIYSSNNSIFLNILCVLPNLRVIRIIVHTKRFKGQS